MSRLIYHHYKASEYLSPPMASAAVCSKAVVMSLYTKYSLLLQLFVEVLCLVFDVCAILYVLSSFAIIQL